MLLENWYSIWLLVIPGGFKYKAQSSGIWQTEENEAEIGINFMDRYRRVRVCLNETMPLI